MRGSNPKPSPRGYATVAHNLRGYLLQNNAIHTALQIDVLISKLNILIML